ncbi:MAG: S8 family serine peptidase, partial [Bdellovibrionales bacterium]|nr:S8 family serine peptidase [Bdellovibrionales bacterium]
PWPTDKGVYPAIVVGAVDETGMMSNFSSHGEEVDIAAPGTRVLAYKDRKTLGFVSGTSFATPIVTGALSSVASLLPGISLEELKTLAKRTAIKTVSFYNAFTGDGAGVINQYAMVRIAARLAFGWPSNRDLLSSDWPYDFTSEIQTRKNQIRELQKKTSSCQSDIALLRLARQNFFLNPSEEETRTLLFGIYRKYDYLSQAVYYNTFKRNTMFPSVVVGLNNRQLQVEVSRGTAASLRGLQSKVSISDGGSIVNLYFIAAYYGRLDALKFIAEEWQPLYKTVPSIKKVLWEMATENKHTAVADYVLKTFPDIPASATKKPRF